MGMLKRMSTMSKGGLEIRR